jgi:aspartate aminotransferase
MTVRVSRRISGVERTLIRRIFDAAPPDAINLGLGQPDLPTPDAVSIAGVAAIVDGRTGYTATAGDPELRRAIAEAHAPFATGPECVCVTVGSQEAMFAACVALLDEGDELLYPDPGYPAYAVIARLLGAKPLPYPLRPERGFRPDPGEILRLVTPRSKVVILCTPSNPTGSVARAEELQPLVGALERAGVVWISDEIYSCFDYDGEFVSPSRFSSGGGIVVSGLSKDFSMTGWRVGWIVGPADFVARATAAHQYVVTCASSVSQRAALGAFTEEGRRARRRYLDLFRCRREAMAQALACIPGIEFERPSGAFYYFVDVSSHGDAGEIAERALVRERVIVIPGAAFGDRAPDWLRLSFAATEQAIREGIFRLRRAILGR